MPAVLDSRGRLFGRFNLIDAALLLFLLLLIPAAYASWLLFQPPQPTISSVELAPLTITEERAAQGTQLAGKLKVLGSGLRPVFRVTIADRPVIAYIFENPGSADVLFGDLPPGTHDLVLYDGNQEVARAAKAVVVPEKPAPAAAEVVVAGVAIDLAPETAARLRVGASYPEGAEPTAEIVALGPARGAHSVINGLVDTPIPGRFERALGLRVKCEGAALSPQECRVGNVALIAGALLVVPGTAGALRVTVDELLPSSPPTPAEVRVRFAGPPSVIDLLEVGQRDELSPALESRAARILSLGDRRSSTGTLSLELSQDRAAVLAGVEAPDRVDIVDATITLGLDPARRGWRYRSQLLRAGGPFTFATPTSVVRGVVLSIRATEDVSVRDHER